MTDEDAGNVHFEDFDFDFINSTITSSSEEMKGSLAVCLEEMKNLKAEASLINEDIASQIDV